MQIWKKAISLLVEENLSSLQYVQSHQITEDYARISQFVETIIRGLPWFYRIPVIFLATIIALLDMINIRNVAKCARKIPLFCMLNKLIRATSFLALFDICPKIYKDTQRSL